MLRKSKLSLAVASALGLTTMTFMPAYAQEEGALEEVVVTGTRIQRANLVMSSPVQQLDAEQFQFTGLTRVEDVLATIPQVSLDQSSGQSIESDGTATVQLRGLGVSRTLVLLDGKRMPINSPTSVESGPDLNLIPMQLVKRVEILTGGASSTYGSDAVAGVINFIMMDDFEGVKLDVQGAEYRHDNSGNAIARATEERGFPVPTGDIDDGGTKDMTFIMGGNLNEDRGNVTAYATYRRIKEVVQGDRDYSACAVTVQEDGSLSCGGSATNQAGSFYFGNDDFTNIYNVQGSEFIEGLGTRYNFAAPSYLQRPDKRYSGGAFGHYDVNEHVEAYTQIMFMDNRTVAQFGPAGVFFDDGFSVNCGNPYLSEQQRGVIGCSGDPDELVDTIFGRRNVEGGPRQGDLRHTTYRGVFGLRGDINDTWRYDLSYQYSEVDMRNENGNYLDLNKANIALKAGLDEEGNIVCTDPSAGAGCVPWNIWETGGVTTAQTDYLEQRYYEKGDTDQEVWMGYVQGDLGDYGVKLPWAENGVDIVLGAEYRNENLNYSPDDASQAGDVGGITAPLVPVNGGYDVSEVYTEASIPLIEGKDWIKSLSLDLGYRYSDYADYSTDTYKFAGTWELDEQVMLRGGFNRAVRAPNIVDQFQPQQGNLFAMDDDPCGNVVDGRSGRGYTFEQCARTGVTQEIWDRGGPTDSPAGQYNTLTGGNTELDPEESDTYTFGFVVQPNFAEGLTVSVDYYDIKVDGAIDSIQQETTLIVCLEQGLFCDSINRGVNDSLWLGNAGPDAGVDALSTNIGFFQVKGIDVEASYNLELDRWGSVLFSTIYGYVDSWNQEEYSGAGEQDCVGVYGGSCETPTFKHANRFSATWATPWDVTLNLGWQYLDGVDQIDTNVPPTDLDSQNYFDLAGSWAVTDYASVRMGINNIFDERPPYVPQGVTARENGNTYPGTYPALGQYLFVGASLQF